MIGAETVTLVRRPGVDQYSDPLPGGPLRIPIDGCKVAPRSSSPTDEVGRDGVVTGWRVYAPAGTTALHTDAIEIRGVECRIDGEIADWGVGVVINASRGEG